MRTGDAVLPAHPHKPLSYSSEQILDRRRRLMREARRMIAEDGLDQFNVRKLCARADVSPRTLYNAFSNKERLIALSIREAFDEFQRFVSYRTDPHTVIGILDRTLSTNRRNFKVRNYTKAIVSIYFSASAPPDIWRTIQDMAVGGWRESLPILRENGTLKPWVDIPTYTEQFGELQFAIINDWCQGRLADQDYLPSIVRATLTFFIGAVQGPPRDEAEAILERLHATGELPAIPAAASTRSR